MIDLWLYLAKFGFLALLYLFVTWAVLVIVKEQKNAPALAQDPAGPLLTVLATGPFGSKVFKLRETAAVGRSSETAVWVEDTAVSAEHARFNLFGKHWSIEDLESSNGTFINGRRLAGRERLRPGDKIVVGRTELIVEIGSDG